jgi:hypothetical protein
MQVVWLDDRQEPKDVQHAEFTDLGISAAGASKFGNSGAGGPLRQVSQGTSSPTPALEGGPLSSINAALMGAQEANKSHNAEEDHVGAMLEHDLALAIQDSAVQAWMADAGVSYLLDDRIPPLHIEFDEAGRCV